MPTANPGLEGVAATLLGVSGTMHRGVTSVGYEVQAFDQSLEETTRLNGQDALAQLTGVQRELARIHAPPGYGDPYRLLGLAATNYAAAARDYIRAAGGNGTGSSRASRAMAAGKQELRTADEELADRPETHVKSVQARGKALIGHFPRAPTKPKPTPHPTPKPKPTPAPTKAAAPPLAPTATPVHIKPTPHTLKPGPTATPLQPTATLRPRTARHHGAPGAHATAVARARARATRLALQRALAHDRAALRAIVDPLNSAASALQKVNDAVTKASSQPDFDPSALARRQKRLQTISAQLQQRATSLNALSVSTSYASARSSLVTAISSYQDAARELQAAISDIESGNHSAVTSDLSRANNDLLQAHAQVTIAQDRLGSTS